MAEFSEGEGGVGGSDVNIIYLCYRKDLFLKMTNFKYEIILYWSAEDEAYIAEVPELPGCMADGESYVEALENAEVIIAKWMETAEELGRLA